MNDKKVWEIKDDAERHTALFNLVSLLEAVAVTLAPFMPATTQKIIGVIEQDGDVLKVKKIDILFPRIRS